MNHDSYPDAYIVDILRSVKTIAVVGASPNEARPSFGVTRFLKTKGYDVVAINPGHAGGEIAGCPVFASLADVPHAIDMVDVFRNSDAAGEAVDEAIAIGAKVVWLQLGVRNDEAAARAEAAGLKVVMNRCPKIEWPRLIG
ncbi:CoA-binding protein [Pinisolibacter sp.]|uniref:CoA-binding protein n=1 Tax=Pinisolibacter sp. TaxID=2172024 RepID=UPI002FDC984E